MADKKSSDTTEESASVKSLDSTGKQKSFRRLITRFAEKTSMVGVAYINSAKFWWAKLIWSFMLLVAIAAMSLHLWYVVDQYTDWPVQTKISLGFETLKFPEVTICNTNVMHKGRLDKYNGASQLKKLIKDLQPENLVPDQFDAGYDPYATKPPANDQNGGQGTGVTGNTNFGSSTKPPLKRRKRFVEEYGNLNMSQYEREGSANPRDVKPTDDDDFDGKVDAQTEIDDTLTELYMDIGKHDRAQLGHNITDMLISCTFNGRECSAKMFQLHQTSEYGNCWSIRSEKFNVKTSGPSGGLSLVLYLEVTEYLKGITTGYGARVQIHEQSTYPFPSDEGLYIPASMETDIGLRMVYISRQGGLYGSCDDGTDLKKNTNIKYTRSVTIVRESGRYGDCDDGVTFMDNYGLKYSRRACQQFCKISKTMEICKCFDDESEEFAETKDSELRPCRSNTEVQCMVNIQNQFESQKLDCNCENPCSEIQYTKGVSQRQWPTDEYAMVLLQGICEKDKAVCASLRNDIDDPSKIRGNRVISKNFLKLNIYYEDLNYENITEVPEIEIQQFLSDVGGAIGLWIGLSILSLCELVQLFVELCDYGIHKTVKERRQKEKKRKKERKRNEDAHSKTHASKDESVWPRTNFGYEDTRARSDIHPYSSPRNGFEKYSNSGRDAMYDRPYRDDFDSYRFYSSRP